MKSSNRLRKKPTVQRGLGGELRLCLKLNPNGQAIARLSQQSLAKGVTIMSGKTDEVKGRIKEAAGALIGNDKLRDEGKTDQVVGKVKQVAEKAVEEVKEVVKKVTE
jgi:uncharacterized protein YjbJ (UPF0337 family)